MNIFLLKEDSSRQVPAGLTRLASNASSSSFSDQMSQSGLMRTIQRNYKDKLTDMKNIRGSTERQLGLLTFWQWWSRGCVSGCWSVGTAWRTGWRLCLLGGLGRCAAGNRPHTWLLLQARLKHSHRAHCTLPKRTDTVVTARFLTHSEWYT